MMAEASRCHWRIVLVTGPVAFESECVSGSLLAVFTLDMRNRPAKCCPVVELEPAIGP